MTAQQDIRAKLPPTLGRRSAYLLVVGIGVAIGTLILGGVALIESRHDTWNNARQSSRNLLIAIDRDVARNITIVDLSLQGALEALTEPGIDQVSPAIRQHALFDRSASAEDLGSLLVLDQHGKIVDDSTSTASRIIDFSDRDYFTAQKADPTRGLYISRAFHSRIGDGDARFALTRAILRPDGTFGGIVSATIRLTYFQRLFETLDIGKDGAITLMRADGRLLFRYPMREKDFDIDVSTHASANFRRFISAQSGQYVATSALDNVERLISFRHVGDLPLILTVSVSTNDIFASWWQKAVVIGVAMLMLCASAIASSIMFWREMLRRTRTEQALAKAAEQLAIQASTDALTGLPNRRIFDTEFDRAFRTAIRNGTPIAVLMIDVDYFKRFNDTYGHVAGDGVLQEIASCLRINLRRPNDCIARYGGEEFVAILLETDENAALIVAQRILAGVGALHIPHARSPTGEVSISVGVAATRPLIGDKPGDLLELADRNLYAAKESGRNRVNASGLTNGSASLANVVLAATASR